MTRSFSADESVLEALKNYDSPTLSNAIELFDVRARDEGYLSHEVRCMFPDLGVMVGYAATATMRARGKPTGGSRSAWAHVREVPGPRVMVVQDLDEPPGHGALWGEVQASTFTALGCVGAVTDGCVRDLEQEFIRWVRSDDFDPDLLPERRSRLQAAIHTKPAPSRIR